jgi:hypothetical protein
LFLLGTPEEWLLSKVKRDCIRDQRVFKTDTEASLKEEELSDGKVAIFTTLSSIKGGEQECSGINGDPKAIEPLPECKLLCAKLREMDINIYHR